MRMCPPPRLRAPDKKRPDTNPTSRRRLRGSPNMSWAFPRGNRSSRLRRQPASAPSHRLEPRRASSHRRRQGIPKLGSRLRGSRTSHRCTLGSAHRLETRNWSSSCREHLPALRRPPPGQEPSSRAAPSRNDPRRSAPLHATRQAPWVSSPQQEPGRGQLRDTIQRHCAIVCHEAIAGPEAKGRRSRSRPEQRCSIPPGYDQLCDALISLTRCTTARAISSGRPSELKMSAPKTTPYGIFAFS